MLRLIRFVKRTIKRIGAMVKRFLPRPVFRLYRFLIELGLTSAFLFRRRLNASFYQRLLILIKLNQISLSVRCTHSNRQMIKVMSAILSISRNLEGCIVQAGCYKGGSTAKISIAANLVQRQLIVFDSFEGMPENNEHLGKGEW